MSDDEIIINSEEEIMANIKSIFATDSLIMSRINIMHIPQMILYFSNIQKLDLSSNPLMSLEGLWNSNLTNLKILNISSCWLSSFPVGAPTFNNSLVELYADGNYLSNFPPNFSVFTKLKKLSLTGNNFDNVPTLPSGIEKLLFRINSVTNIHSNEICLLDLSYCSIHPNVVIDTKQLQNLDLSNCNIMGEFVLPALPLLTVLNIDHNSITKIVLTNSRRIQEIDASYNSLTMFPEFIFNLQLLRKLDLSHNVITVIPSDLSCLKRLELFDISHNSIICNELILPTKLALMRASFNLNITISVIPLSLEELDLSFCKVVVIPIIQKKISLSLFFVDCIQFSENLRPITYNTVAEDNNSLALNKEFEIKKFIRAGSSILDSRTLVNMQPLKNVSFSATSGRSTKYEDNFLSLMHDNILYIGVFDGHVGKESAFISADAFSTLLPKHVSPYFYEDNKTLKKQIKQTFSYVNDELRRRLVKDGTTAVIVGLSKNKIFSANVGDSLALLVNSESSMFLTKVHRPTNSKEYEKLKRQNKNVSDDWRVDGKLCVSRSLGDFWCCGGMYETPSVLVSPIPDDSVAVVVACDGLWDYIDEGSVCNVVRSVNNITDAAKILQDIAFASGSHDSISVVVVDLISMRNK